MGILIKLLLFGIVIYYLVKTIGGFVFRLLGGQAPQQAHRNQTPNRREGDIHIDYVPQDQKRRAGAGSKDGDYVDYEEVK